MKLKTKLMLMMVLLLNVSLFAQNSYTLTGTVTDTDNVPLIGVNVLKAGTSTGTATDLDGNYSLTVNTGDVLQFSYTGYADQSVTIADQRTLNITLAEGTVLDEVVVVGYGSRKKSDVTGAVSSVKSEELTAFPVLDAAQALQGRAAGVVVQSNNGGEPGAPINIKIRGNTSISANSNPLIVVDGFVGATMPQANDIASMEVLKDASATAIYGSRGSNGVVLVTTKKGRSGKLSVELNTTYSSQNPSNRLDLLNASDFVNYQNQIRANNGISTPFPNAGADTDWQDVIYRNGYTQQHQLSFSGGTDDVNFYASGNYFGQDGIVINSGFKRATFLTNVDAKVNDKIKVGLNLFGSRGTKQGITTQSDGSVTVGNDDVISLAMRMAPDKPIRDANGVFTTNDAIGDELDNPFAVASERQDETISDNFRANFYADIELLKGLSFKTTFGLSSENETRGVYQPKTLKVTASAVNGRARLTNAKRTTLLSENYLTYNKELGKGDLTLLAGYSYQKNDTKAFASAGTGFLSDAFSYYALGTATGLLQPASSLSEVEIQSQFGRVNYDFNDLLLLTATVRRDGASNFARNEKYAIFPSAAIGFKVHNLPSFKNNENISSLKVRLSYGATGNPSISPYQSLARFASLYASSNGSTVFAVTPDQPANPDLKWETSYQTNFGVDLGLIDNRINVSLDYYNIDTKDLILGNNGIPEYFGFANDEILTNLGEINNKGFEFSINSRNVVKGNFRWSTDFNITFNKNEVVALINDADLFGDAAPNYFATDRSYVLRVGEEVGLFYGFDYAGVMGSGDAQAGALPFDGGVAGDPVFVDVDGDGSITASDRTIIGNPNPDFTFGFNNTLSFGDFDLGIFFQGSQGGEIFNMTNVQLNNGDANTTYEYYNAAQNGTAPRVGNNSNREISSRFIEDGSYIRLKNLALGYNLPSNITDKIGIGNARLSISAQNILTITDYSGLDPEVNYAADQAGSNFAGNTAQGFDFGNYPTVKSVSFSLNVKF